MATEGAVGTSSVRRGLLCIPGAAMGMDSQNTLKIAVVRQLSCCVVVLVREHDESEVQFADSRWHTGSTPKHTQQPACCLVVSYVDAHPACHAAVLARACYRCFSSA